MKKKKKKKKKERKWFLWVFDWRVEKMENLVGPVFSLQTHQKVFSLNQGESWRENKFKNFFLSKSLSLIWSTKNL